MALTAIAISPNQLLLSSDGVTSALLSYNVVTGVVTSTVLPASTTNWLTARLQQILTADPTLATASFTPQLIRGLFVLNSASFGLTVTETNAVVSGNSWSITLAMSAGQRAYFGMAHSITQPFGVNSPPVIPPATPASPFAYVMTALATQNAVRYLTPFSLVPVTQPAATVPHYVSAPYAGTISQLQIQVSDVILSTTGTIVFVVQKNGVDTTMTITLTCSLFTGTLAYLATTTNPVTVALGDRISVKFTDSGLNATTTLIAGMVMLTPS